MWILYLNWVLMANLCNEQGRNGHSRYGEIYVSTITHMASSVKCRYIWASETRWWRVFSAILKHTFPTCCPPPPPSVIFIQTVLIFNYPFYINSVFFFSFFLSFFPSFLLSFLWVLCHFYALLSYSVLFGRRRYAWIKSWFPQLLL